MSAPKVWKMNCVTTIEIITWRMSPSGGAFSVSTLIARPGFIKFHFKCQRTLARRNHMTVNLCRLFSNLLFYPDNFTVYGIMCH